MDNPSIVNTSVPNKGAEASPFAMYTDNCLQGLGRTGRLMGADFTASIERRDLVVPLLIDFTSLERLTKKHNKRCLGGKYANFFSKLI